LLTIQAGTGPVSATDGHSALPGERIFERTLKRKKGKGNFFDKRAVDITMWKTLWIMCKTLQTMGLRRFHSRYFLPWAGLLFCEIA